MKAIKRIEAIIKPFALEDVRAAIMLAGAGGMTLSEVSEFQGTSEQHVYRGGLYSVGCTSRMKVEVVTTEDRVSDIVRAIMDVFASQGGDVRISVTDVIEVIRIRTGDWGVAAL